MCSWSGNSSLTTFHGFDHHIGHLRPLRMATSILPCHSYRRRGRWGLAKRRPRWPTLCEAPTSPPPITMAWEDAGRHPQWPQVADVVIEAVKCSERTVTAPAAHLDLNLLISVQTFQVLL